MIRILLTTFGSPEDAEPIIRTLVTERLAACGTLVPGGRSIYRWEDKVVDAVETVVLLKTTDERLPELIRRLKEIHPYELPEMITLDPTAVSDEYAAWVKSCT